MWRAIRAEGVVVLWRVMSAGMSAIVAAIGPQHHASELVEARSDVRICWRPSTTRLATKSRMARVSGAEKAARPRKRLENGLLLEPLPPQR